MKMRVLSLAAMIVVAGAALSGCGSSGASPSSNPTTTAPAGHKTAVGSACATQIGAVKGKVTDPSLQSIDATGVCTIITLHTSLADTDLAKAVAMCTDAASVAYTGETASVAVNGQSGKELAAGTKGNPCIGEP